MFVLSYFLSSPLSYMLRKFFLLLILCCWPVLSLGQVFRLNLLQGVGQYKEALLQPITYVGYRLGVGVDFDYQLPNDHCFFAQLMVAGLPTAKTRLGNDMSQINGNLESGYLINTKLFHWQTGPSLQIHYDYALYALNYEHPFWLTQYSLNWANRWQMRPWKQWQLSLAFSLPLVGLLSRTEKEVLRPYKADYQKAFFHRNMTFEALHRFQHLNLSIELTHLSTQHNDFGLGYSMTYFHFNTSRPLTLLHHSICLFVKFNQKHEN